MEAWMWLISCILSPPLSLGLPTHCPVPPALPPSLPLTRSALVPAKFNWRMSSTEHPLARPVGLTLRPTFGPAAILGLHPSSVKQQMHGVSSTDTSPLLGQCGFCSNACSFRSLIGPRSGKEHRGNLEQNESVEDLISRECKCRQRKAQGLFSRLKGWCSGHSDQPPRDRF